MNQILNMALRLLTRKAMNWSMNKGLRSLSGPGRAGGKGAAGSQPQDKNMREAVKRARQAARIAGRLGR